jgi:hypothetical protein
MHNLLRIESAKCKEEQLVLVKQKTLLVVYVCFSLSLSSIGSQSAACGNIPGCQQ